MAYWGQDVAGQIQAQGATIFLRMELLGDAENRQPQGTKEGKEDFGSLHSVLGRKIQVGEGRNFLGAASEPCAGAAPNVAFVTELGQCHGSALTTCCFSVLPALPWPVALAGREGDKPWLVGRTAPSCRAAEDEVLKNRCCEMHQGWSLFSPCLPPCLAQHVSESSLPISKLNPIPLCGIHIIFEQRET